MCRTAKSKFDITQLKSGQLYRVSIIFENNQLLVFDSISPLQYSRCVIRNNQPLTYYYITFRYPDGKKRKVKSHEIVYIKEVSCYV